MIGRWFSSWAPALTHEQVAVVYAYRERERPHTRARIQQIERMALAKMRVQLAGWSDDPDELRKAEEALLLMLRKQKGVKSESNQDPAEPAPAPASALPPRVRTNERPGTAESL